MGDSSARNWAIMASVVSVLALSVTTVIAVLDFRRRAPKE